MRLLRRFVVLGFLLTAMVLELIWALQPRNGFADPYRYAERMKALGQWGQQRTPKSQTALDHERELLHKHQRRQAFLITAILVVEAAVVVLVVRQCIAISRRDPDGSIEKEMGQG